MQERKTAKGSKSRVDIDHVIIGPVARKADCWLEQELLPGVADETIRVKLSFQPQGHKVHATFVITLGEAREEGAAAGPGLELSWVAFGLT
jgi:hypothetical protein